MNQGSRSTLGTRNALRFYLARLRERLWFRPLVSSILSLFAVFLATLVDSTLPTRFLPQISEGSMEKLLSVLSASMLVIAVFAVGAMLSAYAAASNSATPRSFPLVVGDDVSQNALSTFIAAFIFSIVALVALLNGFYEQGGRFALFLITILVFASVILAFVRWVDRIARLGRLGNTIDKVEEATADALKMRARHPTLGARKAETTGQGVGVYPTGVGYVQNIDVARLQAVAEEMDCDISVCVAPGHFATPGRPLAYLPRDLPGGERIQEQILGAFAIGGQRSFESDPQFGLIVLNEIACRAMSPAVNDPGTAKDIIGTLVRLFVHWIHASEEGAPQVEFDRVAMPTLSLDDLFDDAFNTIARDGASSIDVATRVQEALQSLILCGPQEMKEAAAGHARLALKYAEQSLKLPEELEAIRAFAERNFGGNTVAARPVAPAGT